MAESRYNPEFARFLEDARHAAGMGISAYAARLGISPSYYRQIKEGYTPTAERIRSMAAAWGTDPQEWLTKAGIDDVVGGRVGKAVAVEGDAPLPVIGEVDAHGIVGFGPEGPPALEGEMRFALCAAFSSQGAFVTPGDVLYFDTAQIAPKGSHVLVLEEDGTYRLVRFMSASRANPAVLRVLPADTALPKPVEITGRIVARFTGLRKV